MKLTYINILNYYYSDVPNNTEPIPTEDDDRFVMFPLKYDDVWSMYKTSRLFLACRRS